MGNVVSSKTNGNLDLNTDLGKFIKDWAMNEYTVNPSLDPKAPLYSQQLKKRACCTNNPNPAIGLPGFDSKGTFLPSMAIAIPVFSGTDQITAGNCNLVTDDNGNPQQYLYDNADGNFVVSSKAACRTFYPRLCNAVRNNRKGYNIDGKGKEVKVSSNNDYITSDALYGPYGDDLDLNIEYGSVINAYPDCNCENSEYIHWLRKYPKEDNDAPAQSLSQTFDSRCVSPGMSSRTWKPSKDIRSLCITKIKTGNITATDGGSINVQAASTCTTINKDGTVSSTTKNIELPAQKAAREAREAAEAAEAKRIADAAEAKRIADAAEAKRIADAAEAKRIADAAEAKRIADAAEAKRVADAAEAKRIADAADAKRVADAKRIADAKTAVDAKGGIPTVVPTPLPIKGGQPTVGPITIKPPSAPTASSTPFYKNPIFIVICVALLILFVVLIIRRKKSSNSGESADESE